MAYASRCQGGCHACTGEGGQHAGQGGGPRQALNRDCGGRSVVKECGTCSALLSCLGVLYASGSVHRGGRLLVMCVKGKGLCSQLMRGKSSSPACYASCWWRRAQTQAQAGRVGNKLLGGQGHNLGSLNAQSAWSSTIPHRPLSDTALYPAPHRQLPHAALCAHAALTLPGWCCLMTMPTRRNQRSSGT